MEKNNKPTTLAKKPTREETLEILTRHTLFPDDLENNLKIIGEEIIPKYASAKGAEQKRLLIQLSEMTMAVLRSLETDHFIGLMESVTEQYRIPVKELAKQIISDYGCRTSIEKTLASNIAHSYINVLDNTRRLNNELNCKEINGNRTAYIAALSKQVDRTNRQFLNSIMVLKQIKAPVIEMNIRANTAFVSQNQQVNVSQNKVENNEAK